MSRPTNDSPPDIQAALQSKQDAKAIELCNAQACNFSPIHEDPVDAVDSVRNPLAKKRMRSTSRRSV
jgi:hypothetical protein